MEDAIRIGPDMDAVMPILSTYLQELHAELAPLDEGAVATYIPELGLADPNLFGISIATVDGNIYVVGDADFGVTIQSVSKPFMYGAALRQHGRAHVLGRIGVEPTGETFNSIILDDVNNRPFNPMVNAGAIATACLLTESTREAGEARMIDLFSRFAGRQLVIDDAVFRSELATGHRNRAIAWMMLNSGMLDREPDLVLDLYFRQCSALVTCRDLSVMAATLAAHGRNPLTGDQVLAPENVRDVLSVMSTCGMYDYAGQWAFDVGLPAKSGVSGMIAAVVPGQLGIAVYSPRLDAVGNSVRGIAACRRFAQDFQLHVFNHRTDAAAVIRRGYTAAGMTSKRIRSTGDRVMLRAAGNRLSVLELQGPIFFGAAERIIRRLTDLAPGSDALVLDFKRVASVDQAAVELLMRFFRAFAGGPCRIVVTELVGGGALDDLIAAIDGLPDALAPERLADIDTALEAQEDRVLGNGGNGVSLDRLALARLDIFAGLAREDITALESIATTFSFAAGDQIIKAGDEASAFFVVVRGSVSILVDLGQGRSRRIGAVGPGQAFGELALLDGGRRSADAFADVPVMCYGFSIAGITEISATRPRLLTVILGNLIRATSDRLRQANEQIQALQ